MGYHESTDRTELTLTSKRGCLAILLLFLSLGSGCSRDDLVIPPVEAETVELHYDRANAQAPLLPAATYEAAARFTLAQTGGLANGVLTEVRFHIATLPTNCRVKVYGANTASSPGPLLYSADVTAGLAANGWNAHALLNPVTLPNGDLWISIEFSHAGSQRTIGCDPGPRIPDGDWMFASSDSNWRTFQQRFAGSINWNVRGIVEVIR